MHKVALSREKRRQENYYDLRFLLLLARSQRKGFAATELREYFVALIARQ